MTRTVFALACSLAIGVPLPAPAQELPPDAIPKTSCHKAIAQQNRINRYLHRGVVPRMERCWSGLRSSGSVAASFVFRRAGDLWVPASSSLRAGTTLTALDDGAAALRCLDAAMAGTAFPVEASDGDAAEFRAHWSFPVPWPTGLDAVATRLANNGGGGAGPGGAGDCGGSEGPAMACYDCYYVPIVGWLLCGRACAGYSDCTKTPTGGCQMSYPICITGSAFGNLGGLVRY